MPLPTVYFPGGASVQIVMSEDWLPVVCTEDAAYLPAGQGVQDDKPTVVATLPDEQPAHVESPGRAAYVPTAHGVQIDRPADWAKVPTGQEAQALEADDLAIKPGVHLLHKESPCRELYWPSGHASHSVRAVARAINPTKQVLQTVDPIPAENVPVAQTTGSDAPVMPT